MKTGFLRTLIVVLAAFAALSFSVGHDDLREFDAAYIQREVLHESEVGRSARRDLADKLSYAGSRTVSSLTSAAVVPSQVLSALSTCILRC